MKSKTLAAIFSLLPGLGVLSCVKEPPKTGEEERTEMVEAVESAPEPESETLVTPGF
jgi:hypothetical protein